MCQKFRAQFVSMKIQYGEPRMNRIGRVVAVLLLFFLLVAMQVSALLDPIDRDSGAFLTTANGILAGQIPYRDLWSTKPPGIYYLYAVVLAVTGKSLLGVRLILLAANLGTAFLVYLLGRGVWNEDVGILAPLLYLYGLMRYEGLRPLTEPFMVFFICLGLLLLLHYYPDRLTIKRLFLSGLLLGIATLFKQPGFLALPIALALILVAHQEQFLATVDGQGPRGSQRRLPMSIVAFLSGYFLLWAGATLYFFAVQGWDSFVYQVFTVHFERRLPYSFADFRYRTGQHLGYFPVLWLASALFVLFWIGAIISRRITRGDSRIPSGESVFGRARLFELVIMTCLLVSFIPNFRRSHPHYWIQMLPFASLLAAVLFAESLNILRRISSRSVALYVVAIFLLPLAGDIISFFSHLSDKHQVFQIQLEIGQYIKQNTAPSERILVIPAQPQYYFHADRPPLSKIFYFLEQNHLEGVEADTIAALKEDHTRYVVVARDETTQYSAAIERFVAANYVLEKYEPSVDIRIFRRSEAGSTRDLCSAMHTAAPIVLWHSWAGQAKLTLDSLLSGYLDKHPGVTFSREQYDEGDLLAAYQRAVAAGAGPDLLLAPSDWVSPLAEAGQIAPLDVLVRDGMVESLRAEIRPFMRYERLYALPYTAELLDDVTFAEGSADTQAFMLNPNGTAEARCSAIALVSYLIGRY